MYKKVRFSDRFNDGFPQVCDKCDCNIEDGDVCYVDDGNYMCERCYEKTKGESK